MLSLKPYIYPLQLITKSHHLIKEEKKTLIREMAVNKINFFPVVLLVIAGILISGRNIVSGQGQCDFQALKVCWDYVKKEGDMIPPSPDCCNAIQKTDMSCICQHLPPGICTVISMKKVVYVTDYCKKPLGGPTCGSKISLF